MSNDLSAELVAPVDLSAEPVAPVHLSAEPGEAGAHVSLGHASLGLDIGTTSLKVVAFTADGTPVASSSRRTVWFSDQPGGTCLDLPALLTAVDDVCTEIATRLLDLGHRPVALGITGMAETGVMLDGSAQPIWPAIAWHDGRGVEQLERLGEADPTVRQEFSYRTGLPWDPQASFAKIAWLQENHPTDQAQTWLSIPEFIAHAFTGTLAAEPSLLSRTGLIDHPERRPWSRALDALGLPASVIPPIRHAEDGWGRVSSVPSRPELDRARQLLLRATVTVAGHDHIVAAQAAGVSHTGQVFNSCGTADVLLRITDRWPAPEDFERLAAANVSMGFHPRPGHFVVNAGTKAGYVLQLMTDLLGPMPDTASPAEAATADIDVPAFGDNELVLRLRAGTTPADVWNRALRAVSDTSSESMAVLQSALGAYSDVVCGGGWTRFEPVRRVKEAMYHDVTFTDIAEPGCLGAAESAWAAYRR